jgi:hypothetical protein
LEGKQAEQIKVTLNSDVPALLLALPAFVGVLIGSWLDLPGCARGTATCINFVVTHGNLPALTATNSEEWWRPRADEKPARHGGVPLAWASPKVTPYGHEEAAAERRRAA